MKQFAETYRLLISRGRCHATKESSKQTPRKGHQNRPSFTEDSFLRSANPWGFCEAFVPFRMILQFFTATGSTSWERPAEILGTSEGPSRRSRLSECRTHLASDFGHALFRNTRLLSLTTSRILSHFLKGCSLPPPKRCGAPTTLGQLKYMCVETHTLHRCITIIPQKVDVSDLHIVEFPCTQKNPTCKIPHQMLIEYFDAPQIIHLGFSQADLEKWTVMNATSVALVIAMLSFRDITDSLTRYHKFF